MINSLPDFELVIRSRFKSRNHVFPVLSGSLYKALPKNRKVLHKTTELRLISKRGLTHQPQETGFLA
ncbi:MAG: hypothetical protein ICV52_15600 [Microcoleus sp. C1-bin4]|nr:hypothetical protein [Microcoleus sp. C1-bin4]